MIYTVTFNPAVDYVVDIGSVKWGGTNRLSGERIFFGGKGINVSVILHELGVPNKALGFCAGFTGDAVEQGLRDAGIDTDFIHLPQGFTRINVKIRSDKETELNGAGPDIDAASLGKLYDKLEALSEGDTLVLAGSVPKSLPSDIYERIMAKLADRNVRFVADAAGELLLRVLTYRPFLVKPNIHELGETFGTELHGADEAAVYARKLRDMGARNVLVSMGAEGALLIDEHGTEHRCGVFAGELRNSVGAGDSMVAGFIAGCADGDYGYALKLGTACGGATAFSDGLADRAAIDSLMERAEV
ncbi:MAG: 1-phosphofructokinase [Ruminiclostridium sp.]|nr:1-phosphofructokinase [Ruminiclostridium sp.]